MGGPGKVVCIEEAFHLQEEAFQRGFPRKHLRHKANHFGNDREGHRKNLLSTIPDRSHNLAKAHSEASCSWHTDLHRQIR